MGPPCMMANQTWHTGSVYRCKTSYKMTKVWLEFLCSMQTSGSRYRYGYLEQKRTTPTQKSSVWRTSEAVQSSSPSSLSSPSSPHFSTSTSMPFTCNNRSFKSFRMWCFCKVTSQNFNPKLTKSTLSETNSNNQTPKLAGKPSNPHPCSLFWQLLPCCFVCPGACVLRNLMINVYPLSGWWIVICYPLPQNVLQLLKAWVSPDTEYLQMETWANTSSGGSETMLVRSLVHSGGT